MQNNLSTQLLSGAALLLPASALMAHPGHDHSHWFSDINHALFYVGIASVVGAAAFMFKTRRKNMAKKGDNQE